jgi:hypothetical protein
LSHSFTQNHQGSQYSLAIKPSFTTYILSTKASNMPSQKSLPLMASQAQRKSGAPVVSTPGAAKHFPSNKPRPCVATSRAPLTLCHDYIVS